MYFVNIFELQQNIVTVCFEALWNQGFLHICLFRHAAHRTSVSALDMIVGGREQTQPRSRGHLVICLYMTNSLTSPGFLLMSLLFVLFHLSAANDQYAHCFSAYFTSGLILIKLHAFWYAFQTAEGYLKSIGLYYRFSDIF